MKTTDSGRFTTGTIIEGLRAKDNSVISYVYSTYFSKVKKMVMNNSGFSEDAEDLFQDSLLIIIDNIRSSRFKMTSSFGTYLTSVCWHLWLQRLNRQKRDRRSKMDNKEETVEFEPFSTSLYQSELLRLIQFHFNRLDKKSQQLLTLYMNGTPHKVTAQIMGYNSAEYAKIRKYHCKEQLRVLVENDPTFKRLRREMMEN